MKAGALYSILSKKFKNGEILFVDDLKLANTKTKDAKEILTNLGTIEGYEAIATRRNNAALIALGSKSKVTEKSFANINSIEVSEFRNITPTIALKYKYLVISQPEASVELVASKLK